TVQWFPRGVCSHSSFLFFVLCDLIRKSTKRTNLTRVENHDPAIAAVRVLCAFRQRFSGSNREVNSSLRFRHMLNASLNKIGCRLANDVIFITEKANCFNQLFYGERDNLKSCIDRVK
ncbi:hypothetical protein L9F63_019636, partial [Diploptera punctata]